MARIRRLYKGFTTKDYEENGGTFVAYDINLIGEDITNEILTVRGDRVMMPDYGTRIPLLTFEPNDAEVYDIIREDVAEAISHDPRVRLEALDVIPAPDQNAILAIAKLNYVEFNVTSDLYIKINSR